MPAGEPGEGHERPATRARRSSGLGALVMVLLAVFLWWWFGGNGPMTPTTNSERLAPSDSATVGSASDTSPYRPQQPLPDTVQADGFTLEAPTRLRVRYTVGAPECVGTLETPEVVENDASVTVTLHLDAHDKPSGACREIALVQEVVVDLDVPLGGRSVLDGSFPLAQRIPPWE